MTLTSPAGENFDLYVYYDSCSQQPAGQSTQPAGTDDSVHLEWGETWYVPNNSDDSRTVKIEVRQASGTCSPDKSWELKIDGNQ